MESKHIGKAMNAYLAEMFTKWEKENTPAWQNEDIRKSIQEWRAKHPELT